MIFQSLWYDRRINAAVLLGVLCAAAVLTGALLVGDSMRGSLRALTLDRLGRIDTVLQGTSFFEPPEISLQKPWTESVSAILASGAVEKNEKIVAVQILGQDLRSRAKRDEIIINRTLADRLDVKAGDVISLRLNLPQDIPPESSLGRRNDLIVRARTTVNEIIPDEGLGRFSLKADQQAEPLLIVPLEWLQNRLKVAGKINAVFFMTDSPQTVSTPEQRAELEKRFKPSAVDLGMTIDSKKEKTYVKSARMMFTKPQAETIKKAHPDARPGLLYLATSIKALKNGKETPYSTVFAFDLTKEAETSVSALTPRDLRPRLFLNQWTADDLDVSIGDEIELIWFAPENVNETKSQIFRLEGILPMDGLGADPLLVPEVKGFTDEAAIADWDPPFPFDAKKIRKKDEDYWDSHRAAPKAFVQLETGQDLWGSRFGNVTTFILPKSPGRQSGGLPPSLFGLTFLPVKEQGLAASAGTTPFSVLFLSFSFFIIASALMLVTLLFRLSVEMKARQIGIRLAVGWTRRQIARLLLAEGFVIATVGSLLGVGFGVLYARVMVHGLTTWWVDAVTVPFLKFHISPTSLLLGFLGGVVLSLVTIAWTLRSVRKVSAKSLLGGDFFLPQRAGNAAQRSPRNLDTATILLAALALPTAIVGGLVFFRDPVSQAGFFFGTGSLALCIGLREVFFFSGDPYRTGIHSSFGFALSNFVRNPGRSTLCVGLIASTLFLVLSISVFRLEPFRSNYPMQIVETSFPVYGDLNTPEGRDSLAVQDWDNDIFKDYGIRVEAFRVRDGDNAGCLNLYQSKNPRILGAPKSRTASPNMASLERPVTTDPDGVRRVPVVLDANTAMYALQLYGGIGEVYELDDGNGEKIRCEVTGLLTNSIFQGCLMMSEANLLTLFPETGGYRFFLVRTEKPTEGTNEWLVNFLYRTLGDYGAAIESKDRRLERLFAVQNTYLSTFQSLGGIGVLLGLFGLAVVQVRNVWERRKELALFQAVGFSKSRVLLLLLYESFFILLWGLVLALAASVIALLPQFVITRFAVNPVSILVQFAWLVGGMVFVGLVSNVAASLAVLRIPVARELAEER